LKNKVKNLLSNKLLKKGLLDSNYYMIANIGNRAIGFLVIPILARSVSVEEFANYDLFLLITGFLHILVTLGTDSGIAILIAENKKDIDKLSFYYVITIVISLLFLTLLFLSINVVFLFKDTFFTFDRFFWLLIVGYTFFSIINYHTFNFLRWQTEAKKAAIINLFSYISGVLIGVGFIYQNNSIINYLYGLIIGAFLGTLFSLYISKDLIKNFKIIDNAKDSLKELFKLSLPFIPNYIGNNLMQITDRIVILMLFGKYELGIYAVIMRFAQIPQFLSSIITGGFLPVMYNNYKTEDGVKLIKNFFHIYLLFIPILFIVFYLIDDLVIIMFGGNEYVKYAYLLPMALVSILFVNATQCSGFGYTIKRKTHYIMYITFFSVAVNFILSIAFGYWVGLAGIFLGTLLAGIVRTYMHISLSEKLYKFGYSKLYFVTISLCVIIMSFFSFYFKDLI